MRSDVLPLGVLRSSAECSCVSRILLLVPAGMCCIAAGFDTCLSMHTGASCGKSTVGCGVAAAMSVMQVIASACVLQAAKGAWLGPVACPLCLSGMLASHAWFFALTLLL